MDYTLHTVRTRCLNANRLVRSNKTRKCDVRCAFTLIELLVVIAIIAILAAILIPVAGKVIASSHQVQCVSNGRQLLVAMKTYAMENKDQFPNFMGNKDVSLGPRYWLWSDILLQYSELTWSEYYQSNGERPNGMFACPASESGINGGARSDFGVNTQIVGVSQDGGETVEVFRSVLVEDPSKTIAFADSATVDGEGGSTCNRSVSAYTPEGIAYRHSGRANFFFVDGHVKSLTLEETPLEPNQPPWIARQSN